MYRLFVSFVEQKVCKLHITRLSTSHPRVLTAPLMKIYTEETKLLLKKERHLKKKRKKKPSLRHNNTKSVLCVLRIFPRSVTSAVNWLSALGEWVARSRADGRRRSASNGAAEEAVCGDREAGCSSQLLWKAALLNHPLLLLHQVNVCTSQHEIRTRDETRNTECAFFFSSPCFCFFSAPSAIFFLPCLIGFLDQPGWVKLGGEKREGDPEQVRSLFFVVVSLFDRVLVNLSRC